MNKQIIFKDLGLINYKKCWTYQESLFEKILETKSKNRKNKTQLATTNYCSNKTYIQVQVLR